MRAIVVRDGEFRWGADPERLMAALESTGWTKDGRRYTEPDAGNPGDDGYTALCQSVPHLPGMGPHDEIDWAAVHIVATLRYCPEHGVNQWEMTP